MSYDLFSYFGGEESFSAPTEPQNQAGQAGETPDPGSSSTATGASASDACLDDTCDTGKDEKKVVYLASDRLRAQQKPKEQPGDACGTEGSEDSLHGHDRGSIEDDLTDEDRDALSDDPEADEAAADKAELGGGAANTEIVKSDSKTTVTPGSIETKKEEKKPVFNNVTYICYAGHKFLITKFFDQESLATLELEDVRKRLEKDFPELSKQRTKMEWDEKKNIICPMVTGGKKGVSFSQGLKGFFFRSKDLFEKKEPINILAARDGYYEVRENAIGVFIAKAPVVEELEPCREGFKMSLPKIPEDLFAQLVSFFADYAMHEVEVMGVFYWDTEGEQYVLDVPFQNVTKVSIDPCYSEVPLHYIKVAEIHSVRVVPRQTA
ncbi:hypothetical protein L1N85_19725 [Paenibacillus alkaliterrae]|uniref:hypothetical protein n=1 Tax=Paenibacillus alkaliterrae TaxID=320909 RepID=UPI001F3D0795|nr:hypothetical protein [Paenibacillus alkaliterrae]MCF2940626.1 hypothetical protein [Paenibacillus alkaliterrae]